MKKVFILFNVIAVVFFVTNANGQVPTSGELIGLHSVTESQMNSIARPTLGILAYNSDNKTVYVYNGSSWENLNSNGDETKIVADGSVKITGSGTTDDPYIVTAIKSTLTKNDDGSYTFSNGVDPEVIITGSGSSGNVPIVSKSDAFGGCADQFQTNMTKDVTIEGEYFDGDTRVSITGQTVNSVTVSSSTKLTANVTAGNTTGDFDIKVTTNGGTGTLPNGFSIKGALTTYNYTSGEITLSSKMTYNSSVLRKNSGTGWNQQGYSTLYGIPAGKEGHLSFTSLTKRHLMIGLNSDPTRDASYSSIDYAFYLISDGRIYIYENGNYRTISSTNYTSGDNFEVRVGCDGVVTYHKNGSLVYTSTTKASQTLYLDSSFYQKYIRSIQFKNYLLKVV